MSIRREIPEYNGVYFITFTCCKWLPLFEESNGYEAVYKWFNHLKSKGHFVLAYVIMPNHVHALVAFRCTQGESINKIIGNGKRFMAYDIVKKLREMNKVDLLNTLSKFVDRKEKVKGKLHEVFEPSFEWKECLSEKFIEQKLNYIHENPCRGRWNLAEQPFDYKHSSCRYYIYNDEGFYPVTKWDEIADVDLTKPYKPDLK